jgi:hypothetical protein
MKARRYGITISLALGIALASYVVGRAAGVPQTTPLFYSGLLEDQNGPINGAKSIAIRMFDAPAAGTQVCNPSPSGPTQVTVGRFRVPLDATCVAAMHANPELWIEVSVDSQTLPRTKIGAVPFALEADSASNLAPSATVDVGKQATGVLSIANGGTGVNALDPVHTPTLKGGWATYGHAFGPAGVWKDPLGTVHLQGVISGGDVTKTNTNDDNTGAFILDAGYRPSLFRSFVVAAGMPTACLVYVGPHGGVFITTTCAGAAWVSLDGISFRAEQ